MTATGEKVIFGLFAVAAAGLYFGGAFDSPEVFKNKGSAPLDEETKGDQAAIDEDAEPIGAPDATLIRATVMSLGLFEDIGDWRGQPEIADLNGDGHLDLVASIRRWSSSEGAEGLHVWLGDGAGGFNLTVEGIRRDMGYGGSAIADINGDGFLDLGFSGHDTPPQSFLNNGNGTWTASSSGLISEGVCADVAFGDFDQDGFIDMVVMGSFPAAGGLYFFQGDGQGNWELREELLDIERYGNSISAVDIEGDGKLEILAATSTGPRLWGHDGNGFVDRSAGLCALAPTDSMPLNTYGLDPMKYIMGSDLDLLAYDFDGDGVCELVSAGMTYDNHDPLRVFRLDEAGIWQPWGTGIPTDEAVFDLEFAELDGQGPPEIIMCARWGIKVMRISGAGEFELVGRIQNSKGCLNIGAGDFDGDGIDEVVFIGFGGIRALKLQSLRGGQQ